MSDQSSAVKLNKVLNAVTVGASGSFTTSALDTYMTDPAGFFSLQVAVSGSGTCKFEYEISCNKSEGSEGDYLTPTSASDIATGITATSGAGSDGKDIFQFNPELSRSIKIKVTETGGASTVTVSAWLAFQ